MRFRTGLVVGFAAGYVLGSRAGRERYEQLASMARKAVSSARGGGGANEYAGIAADLPDEPVYRDPPREAAVPTRSEGGNGKL